MEENKGLNEEMKNLKERCNWFLDMAADLRPDLAPTTIELIMLEVLTDRTRARRR